MSVSRTTLGASSIIKYGLSRAVARDLRGANTVRWSSSSTRQWSTPLAKNLAEAITTTGPISVAKYMRQCLTSPEGGYYTTRTTKGEDQFGKSGDFVTSPEISQIFGELVGIWFVTEWMAQARIRDGVQLVELGPGRGTLMDDVLRTISNFKPMAAAIDTIYLVEASPLLRDAQKDLLCGPVPLEEHPAGKQAVCKRLPRAKVVWVEDINFIPQGTNETPFIIAHEFFDALPIHAFQSVAPKPGTPSKPQPLRGLTTSTSSIPPPPLKPQNEWRELLVSPTSPPSIINPPKTPGPEFELTVSSTPTHHSRLLPMLSQRYAALLPRAGSTIEISPEAQTTMTYLAELISGRPPPKATIRKANTSTSTSRPPPIQKKKAQPSGAALIIDYGPISTIPVSTFRGIRAHQLHTPFSAAGLVDLSADVDFGALVESALNSSDVIEAHGPVLQADWLESMGGRERWEQLVQRARGARQAVVSEAAAGSTEGDDIVERVNSGWKRLVDRGINGMGKLYKVMAVVPVTEGARRPVGFGGDVVS